MKFAYILGGLTFAAALDAYADCTEADPDCTVGGTVTDVCLWRVLTNVANPNDADYQTAKSTDSALDATFKDTPVLKCYPKADAEALVDISGTAQSDIGITAQYKIIPYDDGTETGTETGTEDDDDDDGAVRAGLSFIVSAAAVAMLY
eukprot:CAMPEP_0170491348 /NCGR_PEP_ID=MMETSP0208-20121228/10842_1 /TAXON_ID=197538 /ORGANISM="Strombidium inclinatum, Strain S3" /LENGTH=147 /DNA_ID=CAMNT_0010766907 /DNA_START=10 /DNA_END=453 /DNA_ORIENTATION=-